MKLVQLKENADGAETGLKIRSLLAPMEYIHLDRLVDVMFTTVGVVEPHALPRPFETVHLQFGITAGTGKPGRGGRAPIGWPSSSRPDGRAADTLLPIV